jgi:hypothetical protein
MMRRRERAQHESDDRHRPYPAAVREAAGAAARERLAGGRSLAREMHLPPLTLQRWLGPNRPRFRPMVVSGGPPSPGRAGGLTVQTARGHRGP